jgi:hypothetical protein
MGIGTTALVSRWMSKVKSPSLIKKVAARPIIIVTCSAPVSPIVATHSL